jgi:hypothetical protein
MRRQFGRGMVIGRENVAEDFPDAVDAQGSTARFPSGFRLPPSILLTLGSSLPFNALTLQRFTLCFASTTFRILLMSKPKKKPSKKAKKRLRRSPKDAISSVLKLLPNHPAHAQLADPENKDRVWVVELVIPPGCFMARSLPEPVDMRALDAEIDVSIQALRTGSPVKCRYVLFVAWSGAHSRRTVEYLTESIPNPKLPFSYSELFNLDAVFHAQ